MTRRARVGQERSSSLLLNAGVRYSSSRHRFHHAYWAVIVFVGFQVSGCLTFSSLQSARIVERGFPTTTIGLGRNNFLEHGQKQPGWTVLDLRSRLGVSRRSDAALRVAATRRDEDGWVGFIVGGDIRASIWANHLVATLPAQVLAGDFEFNTFQLLPGLVATVPMTQNVDLNASGSYYLLAHDFYAPMYSYSLGLGISPTDGTWQLRPELAWLQAGDPRESYRQLGLAVEFRRGKAR
ncbi:MAG: hypothetical protein FJY88_02020 [Candidatus Eisenbacteria bacterium]|nr:hypothetical protein [Candidatus Eisenbacteria bacterium]